MRDLEVTPPLPRQGRNGLAIVALIKDVEPYIEEWVDFHMLAGVSHFFLYDNGSTDKTKNKLHSYQSRGHVTALDWRLDGRDADTGRRFTSQVSAFAHAITTFGENFERFAFIDVDEFMFPKSATGLLESIRLSGSPSNMSLPWHMFGHNNYDELPEGGIIKNFTQRAVLPYRRPDILLRFKCIVDPCKVTHVSVHQFCTIDMGRSTSNAVGTICEHEDRRSPNFFTSHGIQLNHYYCLSKNDLRQKIERGAASFADPDTYRRRVLKKVNEIHENLETDTSAQDFRKSGGL
jgi:hypothetical protein